MAKLHTTAEIRVNPALFGEDLAQPGVSAAQGFFLAAQGAQLFPDNPAAQANFRAWFNVADQLNGFGDAAVQSITASLKPTDVGAIMLNVTAPPGGERGHVLSAEYATLTSDAATSAFTWTRTDVVNNHSNAGDEAVASYSQGNGFGSAGTWAGVDQVRAYGSGPVTGHEIDVQNNGQSTALGLQIVGAKASPDGARAIITDAIQVAPQNYDPAQVLFLNGLHFYGEYQNGVVVVPDGTLAISDGHGTGIVIDAHEIKLIVAGHVVADWVA